MKLMILFCFICGLFTVIIRERKNTKLIDIIKSVIINLVTSLLIYLYYFGYSRQNFYDVVGIYSFNMAFMVISLVVGFLQIVYCHLKEVIPTRESIFIMPKSDRIFLIIIIFLAFLVRVAGYQWGGEGTTFQPDEGKVYSPAMEMAENNTLMSDQINYPSHISHKILSVIYRIYLYFDGRSDIRYTELGCVYLARIYIAIVSTLIVVMVYFIGNAVRSGSGKWAALLVALFPPFISAAHCITGDPIVTLCFCVASLLGIKYYKIHEKDGIRYLIGMALCAAIATLEKYHGMFICGLIAIVVVSKTYKDLKSYLHRILYEGMVSAGAYFIFMAVISPNLIFGGLDKVYEQLFVLSHEYESGATFGGNIMRYASWFFSHSGILVMLFIIVALYAFAKNKNKRALVLGAGMIELIGVAVQNRAFIRWGYPFYVCMLLVAAVGITQINEVVQDQKNKMYKYAILAIEFLVFLNFFAGTVLTEALYVKSNIDTRNVSEKWFLELGADADDCIQTRYTCWNTGGINKYNVDSAYINDSLMMLNGRCYVKRLGKKYAVNNEDRYSIEDVYNSYFTLIKKFVPAYKQSMISFGIYDKFSLKVLEPYSIYNAIKISTNIFMERIFTGQEICIYDIRNIPAYAEFTQEDFEETITEQGQAEYSMQIPAMLRGNYVLVLDKEVENAKLIIQDEFSSIIVNESNESSIRFCIPEDSKNLNMKLILCQDCQFGKVNIIQD